MRLILGAGGYYPYTQKPVDYQPYRPVYLFRGPPPDAGFSYGLFEDEEQGKKYYADLGLDSFSPLSGKSAKLLEEMTSDQIEQLLGDDLKKEHLQKKECLNCSATYFDNFHLGLKGRSESYCHRCGSKLPEATAVAITDITKDPNVQKFVENGLNVISKSSQFKELSERLATRYSMSSTQVKQAILLALKNAIQ